MSTQKVTDQQIQSAIEQLALHGGLGDLALQVLGFMRAEKVSQNRDELDRIRRCNIVVLLDDRSLDAVRVLDHLGLFSRVDLDGISDLGVAVLNHYVDPLVERLMRADEADGVGEISDIAIAILERAAGVSYTEDEAAMQESTFSLSSNDIRIRATQLLVDAKAVSNPLQWEWLATGIGLMVLGRIEALDVI